MNTRQPVQNNDIYNIPINQPFINDQPINNNTNRNERRVIIDNMYNNVLNTATINNIPLDEIINRLNTLSTRRQQNIMEAQIQTITTLRRQLVRRRRQAIQINRTNENPVLNRNNIDDNEFIDMDVSIDNSDDNEPSGNTFPQAPIPSVPSRSPPSTLPPAPRHPHEQTQLQTQCCVCLNTPANYANTSCGHCCLCLDCVERVRNVCPICRSRGPFIRIIHS